jgi:RimJ/RimL family protein N-acetyltransferase
MTARLQIAPSASEVIRVFDGEIVTPRLVLRPVTVADAETMYGLFNDWEVVRWLARPIWPQEFRVYRDSLLYSDRERALGQSLYLVIRAHGEIVGGAAWTVADGLLNLGYWVGRPHWRCGYMTEAAGSMCDWVFAETREQAIYSGVFEGNDASMRVQHKLGFVQIGTSVHYSTPRGRDLLHLDTKLTRTARRVAREKARP